MERDNKGKWMKNGDKKFDILLLLLLLFGGDWEVWLGLDFSPLSWLFSCNHDIGFFVQTSYPKQTYHAFREMSFPFSSKRISWLRCRDSRYAERKSKKNSKIKFRVDRFKISSLSFRRGKVSAETYERKKRFVIKRRFRFKTRFPYRFRFRSRILKSSPQTFASRWHFPHFTSKVRCPFNLHRKFKGRRQKRRRVMDISAPIMNMHHPAGVDESVNVSDLNLNLTISLTVW